VPSVMSPGHSCARQARHYASCRNIVGRYECQASLECPWTGPKPSSPHSWRCAWDPTSGWLWTLPNTEARTIWITWANSQVKYVKDMVNMRQPCVKVASTLRQHFVNIASKLRQCSVKLDSRLRKKCGNSPSRKRQGCINVDFQCCVIVASTLRLLCVNFAATLRQRRGKQQTSGNFALHT
jgi:hypothetical protein